VRRRAKFGGDRSTRCQDVVIFCSIFKTTAVHNLGFFKKNRNFNGR